MPVKRVLLSLLTMPALAFSLLAYPRSPSTGSAVKAAESMPAPEARINAGVDSGDIIVRVILINHGDRLYPLLKWDLPEDGKLSSPLFDVFRDGRQLKYNGVVVKRRVTRDSYLYLHPVSQYESIIGLKQAYDVAPAGKYTIRYHAWNQVSGANLQITSPETTIVK